MSTIVSEKYKCAMCGSTNEYNELASTNTFGSPDLDLRPAEMRRSTMPLWVQECPECGYVSKKVSDPSHVTREWLEFERYQTCDGLDFTSGKCDNAEDILMIRADLMRRAGQFEELLETYSSVRFKKKHLKQIMKCYYSQLCCS